MLTEGISEYVDQALNYSQWGFALPATPYPLSWDQRHSVKVDADFMLFGGIQTNLVLMYSTARPYTYYPTRDGYTPLDTGKAFIPNNKRMFDISFTNVKLSRVLMVGDHQQYTMTVYAHISNLLNRRNVRWMDSSSRVGGELGDPNAYYEPRRIRLGFRLEF